MAHAIALEVIKCICSPAPSCSEFTHYLSAANKSVDIDRHVRFGAAVPTIAYVKGVGPSDDAGARRIPCRPTVPRQSPPLHVPFTERLEIRWHTI